MRFTTRLALTAMLLLGVAALHTETASSQGLATCFTQPTGLGPQPCPTGSTTPYFPETSPKPNYADAQGVVNTFYASLVDGVPAASGTDVVCLNGSATKVVRLKRVDISGTQTTAGQTPVSININTAADTGGTAGTTPTIIKADQSGAATAASLIYYTANPTIVTALGAVKTATVTLPAPATAGAAGLVTRFDFGGYDEAHIVLRGVAQQACINWNAKTTTGNKVDVNFVWTETTN